MSRPLKEMRLRGTACPGPGSRSLRQRGGARLRAHPERVKVAARKHGNRVGGAVHDWLRGQVERRVQQDRDSRQRRELGQQRPVVRLNVAGHRLRPRGDLVVYETENSRLFTSERSWFTIVDFPDPEGAEMRNKIPANALRFSFFVDGPYSRF